MRLDLGLASCGWGLSGDRVMGRDGTENQFQLGINNNFLVESISLLLLLQKALTNSFQLLQTLQNKDTMLSLEAVCKNDKEEVKNVWQMRQLWPKLWPDFQQKELNAQHLVGGKKGT